MKLFKKVLVLILFIGITIGIIRGIGIIGEIWEQRNKKEREEQEIVKKPLKFAVMSDIHSDWENFRKALGKAKVDMGVRDFGEIGDIGGFIIITGDLTTLGKKSELLEAKKILDESGLRYFVIPGNHDIWWGRQYESDVGKKDVWQEVFGESFLSFKNDGVKFILINNGDAVGGIGEIRDIRGIREEDWIKNETEECLKIYCLVFMHMPLNHPNSLHVMGEDNPTVASEAAELIKLFVKNEVKEVFAGHLHFSSSYELGGLRTTIVGAVTSERNFQSPKFLEVLGENSSFKKRDVFLTKE